MRLITTLAVACSFVASMAVSAPINGVDLAADPNISLPNGSDGTVGTSIQFAGSPTNKIIVDADIAAMGFGVSGTTAGSFVINTTRVTDDSDFWIGLYDGSNFDATGFWDGNRIGNYSTAGTSDGQTFSDGNFNGATNLSSVVGIGDMAVITYTFDLIAGTSSLDVNGQSVARNLFGSLNTAASLSFLIGKGSAGETLQIDSIDFGGNGGNNVIPLPAGLPLLATALVFFGFVRRKAA